MTDPVALELERRKVFRKTRTTSANGGASHDSLGGRERMSLEQIIREAGGSARGPTSKSLPYGTVRGASVDTTVEADPLVLIARGTNSSILPVHEERRRLAAPMLSRSSVGQTRKLPFPNPQSGEEVHANAVAEAAATLSLAFGGGQQTQPRSGSAKRPTEGMTNRGATPQKDRGTSASIEAKYRHFDPAYLNTPQRDHSHRSASGSRLPSPHRHDRDPVAHQPSKNSLEATTGHHPSPTKGDQPPKATLKYLIRVEEELRALQAKHGDLCDLLLATTRERHASDMVSAERSQREADILSPEREARDVLGMWFHATLRVITGSQVDGLRRDLSTAYGDLDKAAKVHSKLEAKLEESLRDKESILLGVPVGSSMNTPRRGGQATTNTSLAIAAPFDVSQYQQQQAVNNTALNAATISVVVNETLTTHHKRFERDFMSSFESQMREVEARLTESSALAAQSIENASRLHHSGAGIEAISVAAIEGSITASNKATGAMLDALAKGLNSKMDSVVKSILALDRGVSLEEVEGAMANQSTAISGSIKELGTSIEAMVQRLAIANSSSPPPTGAIGRADIEALLAKHTESMAATIASVAPQTKTKSDEAASVDIDARLASQLALMREQHQAQSEAMNRQQEQFLAKVSTLLAESHTNITTSVGAIGAKIADATTNNGLNALAQQAQHEANYNEVAARHAADVALAVKEAVALSTRSHHDNYRKARRAFATWLEATTPLELDCAGAKNRLFGDSVLAASSSFTVTMAREMAARSDTLITLQKANKELVDAKASSTTTLPSNFASISTPPQLSAATGKQRSTLPPPTVLAVSNHGFANNYTNGSNEASLLAMPKEASQSEPLSAAPMARAKALSSGGHATTIKANNDFDDSSDEDKDSMPKASPQPHSIAITPGVATKLASLPASPAAASASVSAATHKPFSQTTMASLTAPQAAAKNAAPTAQRKGSAMDSSSSSSEAEVKVEVKQTLKDSNTVRDKKKRKSGSDSSSSSLDSVDLELSLTSSLSRSKSFSKRRSSLAKSGKDSGAAPSQPLPDLKATVRRSGSSDSDRPSASARPVAGHNNTIIDRRMDSSSSSDDTPQRGKTMIFGHQGGAYKAQGSSVGGEVDSLLDIKLAPLPVPGMPSQIAVQQHPSASKSSMATSFTSPTVAQPDAAAEAARKKAELEARKRKLFGFDEEDEVPAHSPSARGPSAGSSSIGTPGFTAFAAQSLEQQTPPLVSFSAAATARPTATTYFGVDAPVPSAHAIGAAMLGSGGGGGPQTPKSAMMSTGDPSGQQLSSLPMFPSASAHSSVSSKPAAKKKVLPTW